VSFGSAGLLIFIDPYGVCWEDMFGNLMGFVSSVRLCRHRKSGREGRLRKNLCILRAQAGYSPTTVVDLSCPPFSEGRLTLISALLFIGMTCAGKRRVVLVNGTGDVAEREVASAGWNLQNGVGLYKVCSVAIDEDLEVYSTNPGVFHLLGADRKKLFQLELDDMSPTRSFKREEITKLHLDSLFPGIEPGQVPSVIALSELKGFGPKSASKKMRKFANVNQLLEDVLKSIQRKPAKLNVAIAESSEALVRRSVRVDQPKLFSVPKRTTRGLSVSTQTGFSPR